ncbi:MAG: hypothetical protein FWG64_08470 [Firmicutes bacterium]|nr:hypothetical protein [Bacillota bacterium]
MINKVKNWFNNVKNAWMIVGLLIIVGLTLGSNINFWQQRNQAISVFRDDAEITIQRKVNLSYNMLFLYNTYRDANVEDYEIANLVSYNIEQVLLAVDSVDVRLNTINSTLTSNLGVLALNFTNVADLDNINAMNDILSDIIALDLSLSGSLYNVVAQQFNEMKMQGLGFLSFVGRMPVF